MSYSMRIGRIGVANVKRNVSNAKEVKVKKKYNNAEKKLR